MKKLLFALLILCSIGSNAQNFQIESNKVIWEFNSQKSYSKIYAELLTTGNFEDFVVLDSLISCTIFPTTILYKELGYNNYNIPIYMRDYNISGNVIIVPHNSGSKIMIKNIKFVNKYSDSESFTPAETWFLKRQEYSKSFSKFNKLVDYTFIQLFGLQ